MNDDVNAVLCDVASWVCFLACVPVVVMLVLNMTPVANAIVALVALIALSALAGDGEANFRKSSDAPKSRSQTPYT